MRTWLLVFALLLCAGSLSAQRYDYAYKDSIPFPEDQDWYVDRQHSRFWIKTDSGWSVAEVAHVRNARPWEGNYYVSVGDMKCLVSPEARILFGPSHWIRKHGDLFVGYVCGKGTYLMTQVGDTLAFSPGGEDKSLRGASPEINGEPALCLALYHLGVRRYRSDRIKAWGMINGRGKWIIPPDYDEPFTFENGIARVILKGEERWIDETGIEILPRPAAIDVGK